MNSYLSHFSFTPGIAHIFVNMEFDNDTRQGFRKGAEQDMVKFSDAFRQLGYEIRPFFNKTVEEILRAFNNCE